ncbi:Pol polyprotein, partial [Mucuna pruriens]
MAPSALHHLTFSGPFSMWGLDIIGPIEPKASNGHRFILVAIDYFTKWVEAASYTSMTKSVVVKFIKRDIICRYGLPTHIITNNGTNLSNKTMTELCEQFKIKHHHSTSYHPRMNGVVEACIQYPQLEPAQTYELKSGLIHLLPKFHGHTGENPHKHLKEFQLVCSTMRLQGISEDYIKMKAFPFSLDGAAKDWLYLQPVLFNTWGDMKRTFLEKFFPASRTASIKKEICGIRQHTRETLHEYWERFNKLCATCPHHQINEQLLIQYFYEGLSMMDKSMIDAASGGALMDKTPAAARHLISNMARNTQ